MVSDEEKWLSLGFETFQEQVSFNPAVKSAGAGIIDLRGATSILNLRMIIDCYEIWAINVGNERQKNRDKRELKSVETRFNLPTECHVVLSRHQITFGRVNYG